MNIFNVGTLPNSTYLTFVTMIYILAWGVIVELANFTKVLGKLHPTIHTVLPNWLLSIALHTKYKLRIGSDKLMMTFIMRVMTYAASDKYTTAISLNLTIACVVLTS